MSRKLSSQSHTEYGKESASARESRVGRERDIRADGCRMNVSVVGVVTVVRNRTVEIFDKFVETFHEALAEEAYSPASPFRMCLAQVIEGGLTRIHASPQPGSVGARRG